ncbi:MAG: PAS domain S-box protein [Verrucomicrobia bacterium]|nr:PAS domain S-box protein [Verrucomicrobiota bacterium]
MVELHSQHTAKLAADLSNLMWGADAEGRTTFVSDALLKAAGYEEDTLTGGPLSSLLAGDDGAELSDDLAGQLLNSAHRLPLRLRTRDGATYRIAWDRLPKRDRDGQVTEIVGVARELLPALDPDPLRDAQLDLFDAARTCILGTRPDGAIVYANREAERVLGSASCSVEEALSRRAGPAPGRGGDDGQDAPAGAYDSLVGRNYFELLAPPDGSTSRCVDDASPRRAGPAPGRGDRGAWWRNTKDHIEACLGTHDYETTLLGRNGRRVVMRWSSAPHRSNAGAAPDLVFLFGLDVTEQRRRERDERVRGAIAALAGVSLGLDAYFDAVQLHLTELASFDAAAIVQCDGTAAAVEPLLVSGVAVGLPVDEEIVRAAVRDLQPYACFGATAEAGARGTTPGSYIVLPLVGGGKPLGAFVLAARDPNAFDERHVSFLETIGPDLARALQVHLLCEDLGKLRTAHRVLFAQATEGVLLLDAELRCIEANEAARRLLGAPGRKAVGRGIDALLVTDESLGADDARAVRRKLQELGRTSGCALGTFTLRRESAGGRVEVEAFGARSNGEFLVLLSDATNRNQARRELVERDRALAWFAHATGDAVALLRNGRIEEVNESLLALFGYTLAGELVGRALDVLYEPGQLGQVVKSDGRLPGQFTFTGRRRDGATVRIAAKATAFGDDDPATLLVLRNASTDERLEEHMYRAAQTAGIAELAGSTAREFNDLLVTMLGSATLARSFQPGDPRHAALLGGIRDAASRAAELTSQLLAASRGGRFVVEPVSLNQSVADVLAMIKACIPRGVRVTTGLMPGLPTVEGDPYQFDHVVLQTVLNAIEAMADKGSGDGGELAISTDIHEAGEEPDPDRPDVRPGSYVRLVVADSGPGMDHDTLRRVCEPFFSTKGAGRGLGMAAARSIVTHHNGFLSLTSSPGHGTEIEVLLPTHRIVQHAKEAT